MKNITAIAIAISLIVPFYCLAQYDQASASQITGKIVTPLSKTSVSVLYISPKNKQTVLYFIITRYTKIKGDLVAGSEVKITFVRRLSSGGAYSRVASVIEVLNGTVPSGNATKSEIPAENIRSY